MDQKDRQWRQVIGLVSGVAVAVHAWAEAVHAQSAERLNVPDGFVVEAYAEGLAGPWGMAFGPGGELYVALSHAGLLVRLTDADGDGRAEQPVTLIDDLDRPSAVSWNGDGLWLAEMGRVISLHDPEADSAVKYTVVVDSLPTDGPAGRALLIEPAGRAFYLSIPASCDVCREDDPRRATVLRFGIRGGEQETWARGLRFTAGLAFHPETGELWATDLGRLGLGDRLPPDELNVIRRGRHYGWPYCYGQRVPNPEYGSLQRCDVTTPPVLSFPAHSAPGGIAFYTADMFPAEYHGDAFVALSGSADGGPALSGFKVVRVRVAAGRPVGFEDFVTGWLPRDGRAWGRPVVALVGPDGALYVSDVGSGRIWRVSYRGVGERSVGGGR
ncbi:MAG: PQQ-dependent sugar dehydrogenase [Gemmatimonadota bacterium]|nr:MAG: PQQ-dependent sugar dehydrogenase [Gemmatimonadota bacterium]